MNDILSTIRTGIESVQRAVRSDNFAAEYGYDEDLLRVVLRKSSLVLLEQDPLLLLTYSPNAQFVIPREGLDWTPAMLVSRGVVIHAQTAEVVLFPFHKFFNLGEHPVWGDPQRIKNVVSVTEKMDGIMIQFGYFRNELICASRHKLFSPAANQALQMLEASKVKVPHGYTLICELVHEQYPPPNPARVRYPQNGLYLLFLRDMRSFALIPASAFYGEQQVAPPVYLPRQYQATRIEDIRQIIQDEEKDRRIEGVVVQDSEGKGNLLVKVKSLGYLEGLLVMRNLSLQTLLEKYKTEGLDALDSLIATYAEVEWLQETEASRLAELIRATEEKVREEVATYQQAKTVQEIPEPMRWVWGYRGTPEKMERAIRITVCHRIEREVRELK